MRSTTLYDLGLVDADDTEAARDGVAHAAMVTFNAARYALRTPDVEGATSLAFHALALLALLGHGLAARAAAGLARTLANLGNPYAPLAAGLAVDRRDETAIEVWDMTALSPIDAAEGLLLEEASRFLFETGVSAVRLPGSRLGDATDEPTSVIVHTVGRLGLPADAFRRMGRQDSAAAAAEEVLRVGATQIRIAMQDQYHWRRLHARIAPIEAELLFAGVVFSATQQRDGTAASDALTADPVVHAILATVSDLRPDDPGFGISGLVGDDSDVPPVISPLAEGPIDW